MSLEEKLLESIRNLKAMGEQCIDLATKVAEEFTKEKETKKERRASARVGELSEGQVFVFNDRTFKLQGDHLPAFVPSSLSVRTGETVRTGFMVIHLFSARQIEPIVTNGDIFYFSGDFLVMVTEKA